MKPLIIFFYVLNSVSLIITSFMCIISFTSHLYQKFKSELMCYVILSEILHSLSTYLSFFRNSCFDAENIDPSCYRISTIGLVQSFIDLYSDMWTLITCCIISFSIYDLINRNSTILNKNKNKHICRFIIFIVPPLISLIVIIIEQLVFIPKGTWKDAGNGQCLELNCLFAKDLIIALSCIVIVLLLFMLVITLIIYIFIRRNFLLEKLENSQFIEQKIKSVQFKNLLFPITSWLI